MIEIIVAGCPEILIVSVSIDRLSVPIPALIKTIPANTERNSASSVSTIIFCALFFRMVFSYSWVTGSKGL